MQGLTDLRDKSESLNHELKQMEEQNFQYTNEITKLQEQIQSITLETTKEETRKKNLDCNSICLLDDTWLCFFFPI